MTTTTTTMSTSERPGLLQLTTAAARGELGVLGPRPALAVEERARLEQRVRLLAWAGNGWHLVEFAVALGAGIAAGSVALVGFGLDSLIEVAAAGVVIWLFSGGRGSSHAAERRAQQLIAASYGLLVAYISVEAARDLIGAHHPAVSGQNMICAYLSVALLIGLLLNALAGWWWADPVAALAIAALAAKEGREVWRGESCDCC